MEILGGGLVSGRVFTTSELRGGAPVAVIEQRTVDRLFGAHDPLGAIVRIGGRPFRVLGVWQRPTNIFEVPGAPEIAGIVPFEAARQRRSEEHTSELQSPYDLVCRLLLEKKNNA